MDDLTSSLADFAASSDSKMIIDSPESLLRVQCPVTNPGACATLGTTTSRNSLTPASGSLIVTLTTTACMLTSVGRGVGTTTVCERPWSWGDFQISGPATGRSCPGCRGRRAAEGCSGGPCR